MLKYSPGMFDEFKKVGNYEYWNQFSEIMIGLGYEMDCCNSFEEYRKNSTLQLTPAHSEREERRNILYLLEHANRQIVGNYLLSQWRYYTHWAQLSDPYTTDFLQRIIAILESKYENGAIDWSNSPFSSVKFMLYCYLYEDRT